NRPPASHLVLSRTRTLVRRILAHMFRHGRGGDDPPANNGLSARRRVLERTHIRSRGSPAHVSRDSWGGDDAAADDGLLRYGIAFVSVLCDVHQNLLEISKKWID